MRHFQFKEIFVRDDESALEALRKTSLDGFEIKAVRKGTIKLESGLQHGTYILMQAEEET